MKLPGIRRRRRTEDGAVAILVAALSIALFMFAALAVDISKQVNSKHELQNQLDAAAVAAGYYLDTKAVGCDTAQPSKTCLAVAVEKAADYFKRDYGKDLDLHNVQFWCVVARRQTTTLPRTPTNPAQAALFQIPTNAYGKGVCNPDASGADASCAGPKTCFQKQNYLATTRTWDGAKFDMSCNSEQCAIPCALKAGPGNNWVAGKSSLNNQDITCNTIQVASEQGVPFHFAPAGGIDEGSTGSQVSVACKGSCGAIAVNPMDVVVIADRTPSMSTTNRQALVNGIRSMLTVMSPNQQFVSIGTIARSYTTNRSTAACGTRGGITSPSDTINSGQWVPLKFYDNYLDAGGNVASSSIVGQALTCIYGGNSPVGNTSLAAPLKAAARYVLGSPFEANNIQSELDGASRVGEIRKVIIFETDGQPYELGTQAAYTGLSSTTDPMSQYNHTTSTTANTSTTDPLRTNVTPNGSWPTPAPSTTYRVSGTNYTIRYNQSVITRDQSSTITQDGGQQACKNFQAVAADAKAQGVLIITMGYNMSTSTMCADNNPAPSSNLTTNTTHYISGLVPTVGTTWTPNLNQCRSGSGTSGSPYVLKTATCRTNVTVTVTSTTTTTGSVTIDRADDQEVTDVLADAAGATNVPASVSNGCGDATARSQENGDGDFFFCAATGDDMGPIFQTALSQVSTGVKLLSGIPR